MTKAFISVGSDIRPSRNLPMAVSLLSDRMRIVRASNVYSTRPVGMGGPRFYNCMLAASTRKEPHEIKFGVLKQIEDEMGRARGGNRYKPRVIDLDLIVYDDEVVDEGGLVLPDPDICTRPFLARCLYELEPGMTLPGLNTGVRALSESIGTEGMRRLPGMTRLVRHAISSSHRHGASLAGPGRRRPSARNPAR